jgi:hypothetical protein
MLNVLLHDLRASALWLLPVIFVGLAGALPTARVGQAFFWWNILLATATALLAPTVEWREGTSTFLHSLPASRDQVVAARFVGGALAILIVCIVAAALALGVAAAVSAVGRPWPAWVTGDVLLAFVVVAASVIGPSLVLIFRFGLGPGSAASAVYLLACAACVEAAGTWVGGDVGSADLRFEAAGGIVRAAVSAAAGRMGFPVAAIGAVTAAGLIMWGTARAAQRAHRRREF